MTQMFEAQGVQNAGQMAMMMQMAQMMSSMNQSQPQAQQVAPMQPQDHLSNASQYNALSQAPNMVSPMS